MRAWLLVPELRLTSSCCCCRWYSDSDISILFPANVVLDGDILIRVRHMSQDGRRVSMLRFVSAAVRSGWSTLLCARAQGFHTGYIQPGNARFMRSDIDGAYVDKR